MPITRKAGPIALTNSRRWFSHPRAAQYLGISQDSLKLYARQGKIPAVRGVRGELTYYREALDAYSARRSDNHLRIARDRPFGRKNPLYRENLDKLILLLNITSFPIDVIAKEFGVTKSDISLVNKNLLHCDLRARAQKREKARRAKAHAAYIAKEQTYAEEIKREFPSFTAACRGRNIAMELLSRPQKKFRLTVPVSDKSRSVVVYLHKADATHTSYNCNYARVHCPTSIRPREWLVAIRTHFHSCMDYTIPGRALQDRKGKPLYLPLHERMKRNKQTPWSRWYCYKNRLDLLFDA